MSDPILDKLRDIEDTVETRFDQLERRLAPVERFYTQATGILAAIRFIGSGSLLLIVAGTVWFMLR